MFILPRKKLIDLFKKNYVHPNNFSEKSIRFSSTYVMKPYSFAFGKSTNQIDYMTIGQSLEAKANSNPKKIAIYSLHENISKTFEDFNNEVNSLASNLRNELGLRRGDVVALWSANCYKWLLVQYACAKLGLILVTLNPVYKQKELEYALVKSNAKTLFLPGDETKQKNVNNYSNVLSLVDFSKTSIQNIVHIDSEIKKFNQEKINLHSLNGLIKNRNNIQDFNDVNSDDPAIIMFTSGTTGKPKGALLSHSNLINNANLTGIRLNVDKNINNNIACIPVPLFHIFGLVYGSIMMTKLGLPIVLPSFKYNLNSVINSINKLNCTHAMIVPAMTVDLLNYAQKNSTKISSLKTIITGSALTPVEIAKKFLKTFPSVKKFYIRYGSTETGGCMTMPFPDDLPLSTIDNIGYPLDFVQIKIVDPKTNRLVKIGEQGEIWAKGHNVMLCYWQDQEKTNKEITQCKWFKTGDLGIMDESGKIKLLGRCKEMIIRGGENIYPKEIEELLHQHDSIEEAFVCGVPDERNGEEVCAWIKLKDTHHSKITSDEIKSFCKDKISYFKIPKYILFVQKFPRTLTGKAKKFEMTNQSIKILNLNTIK